MRIRNGEIQAEILAVMDRQRGSMKAYDILNELRKSHSKIAPTTIYRALDALIDQGRVHRLESLNAFVTCQVDHNKHSSILSICDDCGVVDETVSPEITREISRSVGKSGFEPSRQVIEIHGHCGQCDEEEAPAIKELKQ